MTQKEKQRHAQLWANTLNVALSRLPERTFVSHPRYSPHTIASGLRIAARYMGGLPPGIGVSLHDDGRVSIGHRTKPSEVIDQRLSTSLIKEQAKLVSNGKLSSYTFSTDFFLANQAFFTELEKKLDIIYKHNANDRTTTIL